MSKRVNNPPANAAIEKNCRHIPEPSSEDWQAYNIAKRRIREIYVDSEGKIDQLLELLKL